MPYFTSMVLEAYLSGAWVNLSADWLIPEPTEVEWGISGVDPLDIMPDIGEMRFVLKNTDGKYYPNGGSPLAGWGNGVKVRLTFNYASGSRKFLYYIESINLRAELTEEQDTVQVVALDWIKFAESHPILAPDIEENKRADEGIQTILTAMPQPPVSSELQTGTQTFPVIFDGVGMRTTAYTEFSKFVNSEYGTLALLKDATNGEKLKFFNYDANLSSALTTSIDATYNNVTLTYGNNIINRGVVTAYPKRIDTEPKVLYSLNKAMPFNGSTPIAFRAKYTDPDGGAKVNAIGSSMLPPEEPGAVDPYLMTLLNFSTALEDETGRHTWTAGDSTNILWNDVYVDGYGTAYSNNILGRYLVLGGYPNYNLTAPTSADFEFGSGAFTVGWYENIINPAVGNTAMARDNSYIPPFLLGYPTAANRMSVWFSSDGVSFDIGYRRDLGEINVGRWTYYEVSRDEDGWFYCFADGKLTDKWYSSLAIKASTGAWTIGQTRGNDWAWMAFDSFFIRKGQCLHKTDFERPLRNIEPTLEGDYQLNSLEDDTGLDLSEGLVVTPSYGSEAVTYELTKDFTGYSGTGRVPSQTWITKLQARGRGVYAYNSIENNVTDATSAAAWGYREINLDQKYQTDVKFGTEVMTRIVAAEKDPRTRLESISFLANKDTDSMTNFMERDIHDLIHVTDAARGVDNFFFIQKIKFRIQNNETAQVTWYLKSALDVDIAQPPPVPPTFQGVIGINDLSVRTTLESITLTQDYFNAVTITVDDLSVPTTITDTSFSSGHSPVTVSDTTSIDLTLTGQALSAAAIFGTTAGVVAEGNHTHSGIISDGDKGDITVSGSGATWTIDNDAVTLAKMDNMATASLIYRKTAGTGDPEVNTLATLKTDLGLTGTNSGDQTSIVGITGTKAQFDTAVTDGNILYVGDVTQYTDELAQDAVGGMLLDTATIDLTYTDLTPSLSADVKDASITFAKMQHIATDRLLGRDTALSGDVEEISLNSTLEFTGAGAVQRAALTGAITATAGSNTTALGSFTTAQLNTALSDNDIATGGGSATGANTVDVTLAGTPNYLTIAGQAITRALIALTHMADVATSTVFYRKTAGTGSPEVQTLATLKTDLGLTGTNSGDQTITLTGDVTGSGTGSFAATIANAAVTLAKMANMATASVFYRKTAGTGAPEVQTLATLKTDLGLTGTNSGDQTITLTGNVTGSGTGSFATTIANNAVTLAKLATQASDTILANITAGTAVPTAVALAANQFLAKSSTGNIAAKTITDFGLSLIDDAAASNARTTLGVTVYDTETAQDAIGAMVGASLVYTDATPLLARAALTGDVTASANSNATTIANAAVSLAKMANLAQDQFIGRVTASTGVPETATITAAARTVLDDATVAAMLATMGGAPLASPTFTGTPAAPTAAQGTNTTQLATTAFVTTAAREKLTANRTYYVGYDKGTCTMTIASPCVVTDVAHGMSANDPIVFRTTGALPTGVTAGTTYYIISTGLATDTFRFSTTVGGAAVNTSGSQSGTHSYHTGNNSNAGLTTGRAGAFLTIQKAVDTLVGVDIQAYSVTIQVSDGLFTTPVVVSSPWLGLGAGTVTIQGNSGTPANCVISTTSADAVTVKNGGQMIIKDLKVITTTTGYSFISKDYGVLQFTNIDFGASAYEHISTANGSVEAIGNYAISGGARRHISNFGGQVRIQIRTITLSGTPAWSVEGVLSQGGVVYINTNTYAGTGATGTRYLANNNGVIYTNSGGATYLPGNVAGSVATGGQYT